MLIWLLRHGLTELGAQKRYQGRLDTPLSPEGQDALQKAPFRPGKLYASPLLRAKETAEILFPEMEPVLIPELREMDFGEFEGKNWQELSYSAAYRAWVDGSCLGRCPGGEDKAGYCGRVCGAFEDLVRVCLEHNIASIAVVAHGGTQMAVLERWGTGDRSYWQWQRPCGCGWLLDTESWPQRLRIREEVCLTR